jgi:alkyldihydroxyacetonephosphate synthase
MSAGTASAPSSDLLAELARSLPNLRASADPADRVAYARDLWPRHHLAVRRGEVARESPSVIVWPASTDEVAALVRWANATRTPLVPFGAGSGVCAGVLPHPGNVVVDLKRLSRIRAIDERAPLVEVEAGFMGVPFEREMNRRGFTLGHFPSSILCSTVGGWVAARSAGQCSGHYGKIEDMVVALECVTGRGDVVRLAQRVHGPSLVPLVVGSEGTLAIVTSATLRLHAAPRERAFGAFSFPTTEAGFEALRRLFQEGFRPAVSRLYDPFDAMLARSGGVKKAKAAPRAGASAKGARAATKAPGLGGAALRALLRHPDAFNELLDTRLATRALGGALLVLVFDGNGGEPSRELDRARALLGPLGTYEGDGPAQRWFLHRYAVSYRQAPVFAMGMFVDTMEVATTWSNLGALYDGVRRALGEHVFVMAHFSHAYPDGCCIYFSFAGTAARDAPTGRTHDGWDEACEATYDRAWRAALEAVVAHGGTIAHHHGVGRSKAPRLSAELGAGMDLYRATKRAFDPNGILNPGALTPESTAPFARS